MNVVNGTVRRAGGAAYVEAAGGVRWPLEGGPGADGQAVAYGSPPRTSVARHTVAAACPGRSSSSSRPAPRPSS